MMYLYLYRTEIQIFLQLDKKRGPILDWSTKGGNENVAVFFHIMPTSIMS